MRDLFAGTEWNRLERGALSGGMLKSEVASGLISGVAFAGKRENDSLYYEKK